MKGRILHIAVENFANLPWTIVQYERKMGFESNLVTLYRTFQQYNDEISLELPFLSKSRLVRLAKGGKGIDNSRRKSDDLPPVWKPRSVFHRLLFSMRDAYWKLLLRNHAVHKLIEDADIIVLDGGSGILRSGEIIKNSGKDKIVEIFYGSDLRTRGMIEPVDEITKLRFTMEYDHIELYPGIEFLFFPFDSSKIPKKLRKEPEETIRIGHSPTNRLAKGTDIILDCLEELSENYPIEIVLIENLPYQQAIELKSSCDIFIDQIGELGYGISALEAIAMGIPTMVQLLPDFAEFLGNHPFVNINADNISSKVTEFVDNRELFSYYGEKGRTWLQKTHNPEKSIEKIFKRYRELGWLEELQ